jgi:hypothetical protein
MTAPDYHPGDMSCTIAMNGRLPASEPDFDLDQRMQCKQKLAEKAQHR